jgi:hypothetical protein
MKRQVTPLPCRRRAVVSRALTDRGRVDKLAVRYQATIAAADIFIWLRARPDQSRGNPRNTP